MLLGSHEGNQPVAMPSPALVGQDPTDLPWQTSVGCQVQLAVFDLDDDFVKPSVAPPRPVKGRVVLYCDLPDIEKPYQELTE